MDLDDFARASVARLTTMYTRLGLSEHDSMISMLDVVAGVRLRIEPADAVLGAFLDAAEQVILGRLAVICPAEPSCSERITRHASTRAAAEGRRAATGEGQDDV